MIGNGSIKAWRVVGVWLYLRRSVFYALVGLVAACAMEAGSESEPEVNFQSVQDACLEDARQICRDKVSARDRHGVLRCLSLNASIVSNVCRAFLERRRGAQQTEAERSTALPNAVLGLEYFYVEGDASERRTLRFTGAECSEQAPLIVFIHGGGWTIGDKDRAARFKAGFFTQNGYAFATVNYRLRPDVEVHESALDIVEAIAWLISNADALGIDTETIILQGHSAGAHLAALIALDPSYLESAGVSPNRIQAVSLLDGAGYDIPRQIREGSNGELYRTVFGEDPRYLQKMSPFNHVGRLSPPASFLIHYVDGRPASKNQSLALAGAIRAAGGKAAAIPAKGKTHATINREFGLPDDVPTQELISFLGESAPACPSKR